MNYTVFAIASLKPLAISNYNISQNAISMNKSLNFCHLKMAIKSFKYIDALCSRIWFVFPQRPETIHEDANTQNDTEHEAQEISETEWKQSYNQPVASPHQGRIHDF